MKNKLKYLILLIIFIPFIKVNAATGLVDLYTSNKYPAPGNTFEITVYCKSDTTIGTCEYTLTYDSSKVKLMNSHSEDCNGPKCISFVNKKSEVKKFTFKALANGKTTISANAINILEMDKEDAMKASASPTTIIIKTPEPAKPKVYSTNNYLSSLTVNGKKLIPDFNKNTLEYNIDLDSSIEEISIEAKAEDSKAKISGTGKQKVTEGKNVFNVVVTSEKGTKKIYKVNVNLKDENPIEVTIDNKKYNVIKRKSVLTKPELFKEQEVIINETKIPGFYNETTDYTLIGLKDEEGNINLYIYNDNNNTYKLYQ